MNFKKLGNTDLKVSTICLGTMTWGEQNNQKEAFEQMDYAIDQEVNFFDTAELYAIPAKKETYGTTEKIIGDWFNKRKNRNKVILATKIAGSGISYIRNGELQFTEKNIGLAINDSLKRLKTDYIDLYQLHWPARKTNYFGRFGYELKDQDNDQTNFEEILFSLEKFIKQGKIRYIGLSNETPWGISKCLELSKLKKLPRVVSVQNPYNLLNRTYQVGLAEISIKEQCGLLGYSPLAFGYLTGKYRNNKLPKNSRMALFGDYFTRYKKVNAEPAIEKYHKICKEFNIVPAQMAIKFCEIQNFLTSVIIGATTMEQLKINIESVSVKLSKQILEKINEVQKIYPNPCP